MATAAASPPAHGAQRVRVDGREFWSTGGRVARFIETMCVLTNGRWLGEPFQLMPWQERLLWELFEVDAVTGRRRYRRALIGLPRKSGKTELLAAILLYMTLADGEPAAACYCAAAAEEQADILFEAARRMCEIDGAPLAELVEVQASRLVSRADPYSFIQRLSARGRTKHGLNPHAVALDELHAWNLGEGEELWAALSTGSAARRQPLQIAITTAGVDLEESRCGALYQLGRAIERGEADEAGLYFRWWQAPDGCDYRDPAMWRMASPSYGVTIAEDYYRQELATIPEAVFRRLYLNQWVDVGDAPWVTREQLERCRVPPFELLPDEPTWVGVDLSESRDSTAVAWGQWRDDAGRSCGHAAGERCLWLRVRTWEQARLPDGRPDPEWEVPLGEVKQFIRGLNRDLDVITNVFDPWHSRLMRQDLEGDGIVCEEIWQTGARRSGASAALHDLIVDGRVHWCDEEFERHCLNATIKAAGADGAYYLSKRRRGRVMDAAMAAVNVVYGIEHAPPRARGAAVHVFTLEGEM